MKVHTFELLPAPGSGVRHLPHDGLQPPLQDLAVFSQKLNCREGEEEGGGRRGREWRRRRGGGGRERGREEGGRGGGGGEGEGEGEGGEVNPAAVFKESDTVISTVSL